MKTAAELRNEARRIREFALTVTDPEVLEEVLALAEELERRARERASEWGYDDTGGTVGRVDGRPGEWGCDGCCG